MTGEVVDLAARRAAQEPVQATLEGAAVCAACRHRWHAVAPCGTASLECPSCGAMRGVFVHPLGPPEGELLFVCDCGSELFILRPAGAWCVGCGTYARGAW